MKRKGFTLVELLAVIAILAILLIIAVPNVLKFYRNSKERLFVTEIQSVLRNANIAYGRAVLNSNNKKCIDSSIFKLDLEGKEYEYYVEFNDNEKVINLMVSDGNYLLDIENNDKPINIEDIGISDSDKLYKSKVYNNEVILTCN